MTNKPHLSQNFIAGLLAKRSFCTLATTSNDNHPHVAGVVYAYVDGALYVSTQRSSRKARNLSENQNVFVCVPVRRMPFGPPPSTVQFASTATILSSDHPEIVDLAKRGRIKAITSHGERDMPDGCFLRIDPPKLYLTYGLGMSLRRLAKDPLNAAGRLAL
jgi:general stress protein 26